MGPNLVNLSTGAFKNFAITEWAHLRVEGTFTNILNHTNLGDRNMNLSLSTFGLISGTVGSSNSSSSSSDQGGTRTGQVSARIDF